MKIDLHLAQNAALNAAQQIGYAAWSSGLQNMDSDNGMQRKYIIQARKYLMDALDALSIYQGKLPEEETPEQVKA